jgi:hypothetical protein
LAAAPWVPTHWYRHAPPPTSVLIRLLTHSGDGFFGSVTYIQRMNTFGGAAPTTPCIDGEKVSVPYNANYIFWGN